jgi:hypothetical protein
MLTPMRLAFFSLVAALTAAWLAVVLYHADPAHWRVSCISTIDHGNRCPTRAS